MTIYKGYVTPIIWFEKAGRFLNDISTGFLEINTAGIGVCLRSADRKEAHPVALRLTPPCVSIISWKYSQIKTIDIVSSSQ